MFISHVKKGQLFFLATFAAMIVTGTCLLSIPLWTPQNNYPFINALFMSVSAVCVTGLATNEICEFSLAGQMIILFLVQLGAIGIMTLSASILLALGRGFSTYQCCQQSHSQNGLTHNAREAHSYLSFHSSKY